MIRYRDLAGPIKLLASTFMAVMVAGCLPLSAKDLRTSSFSGQEAFSVGRPLNEVYNNTFQISKRCLYPEGGVVNQYCDENGDKSNITYSFTDSGYFLTTITVDMMSAANESTNVTIYYCPSINSKWQRYAEKIKQWALRQSDDCNFELQEASVESASMRTP